jgi:hypothetical protein
LLIGPTIKPWIAVYIPIMDNIKRANRELVLVGLLHINKSTFRINNSSLFVIERVAFDAIILFESRTRVVERTNKFASLSVIPIDYSCLPISKEEEVLLD